MKFEGSLHFGFLFLLLIFVILLHIIFSVFSIPIIEMRLGSLLNFLRGQDLYTTHFTHNNFICTLGMELLSDMNVYIYFFDSEVNEQV